MESNHLATVRICGSYNEAYKSKYLNDIINSELSPEILEERSLMFKILKPLTDIFENGWTGTMAFCVDDGYSETLSYNHPTAIAPEITFLLAHNCKPESQVPMRQYEQLELLDDIRLYLLANQRNHTEELRNIYSKVCKNLLKHYKYKCKISRSMDYTSHLFRITPNVGSKHCLFFQMILVPKYRSTYPIQRSSLSDNAI